MVEKHPIPSPKDLGSALDLIKKRYSEHYAKPKRADRRELAQALLLDAEGESGNPTLHYTYLVEARDQSVLGLGIESALKAVERLKQAFLVDGPSMQIDTLVQLCGHEKLQRSQVGSLAELAMDLARQALLIENADEAATLVSALTGPVAMRGVDKEIKADFSRLRSDLEFLQEGLAALETLQTNPSDQEAKTVGGMFLCYTRLELKAGLTLVKDGSDLNLASCASVDLLTPEDVDDCISVANQWKEWRRKSTTRPRQYRSFADQRILYWLKRAEPSLRETQKTDVLAEIQKLEKTRTANPSKKEHSTPKKVRRRSGANKPTVRAVEQACAWLLEHQDADGYWDLNGLMEPCETKEGEEEYCGSPGEARQDVGVTALALLALMKEGHPGGKEPIDRAIHRGLQWLVDQQGQGEDGGPALFGENLFHSFVYDHAIATLALARGYGMEADPEWGRACAAGVSYILAARNRYSAWRYDVPALGENDTSVTAWMVMALAEATASGVALDREKVEQAYVRAINWVHEVTEPDNGRIGYRQVGSESSRSEGVNNHYPTKIGEAMTAAGIHLQLLAGVRPEEIPSLEKSLTLLKKTLPEWKETLGSDMYYWLHASLALSELGGQTERTWRTALRSAVLDHQRTKGHVRGSWDPVGPWGFSGGRVYSTAVMALSLSAGWD